MPPTYLIKQITEIVKTATARRAIGDAPQEQKNIEKEEKRKEKEKKKRRGVVRKRGESSNDYSM